MVGTRQFIGGFQKRKAASLFFSQGDKSPVTLADAVHPASFRQAEEVTRIFQGMIEGPYIPSKRRNSSFELFLQASFAQTTYSEQHKELLAVRVLNIATQRAKETA